MFISFGFSVLLLRGYLYGIKTGEWKFNLQLVYIIHKISYQTNYLVYTLMTYHFFAYTLRIDDYTRWFHSSYALMWFRADVRLRKLCI